MPTTSRSSAVSREPRSAVWSATKPVNATGEPAIVPARFGMKPMLRSRAASASREPSGADCVVWMVNMVGSVTPDAPPLNSQRGNRIAPAADVQSAHDPRREPRRGPDAPLAARAPDEPARAGRRGRRDPAARELRRERPRESEPRDGAGAGPGARRAAARAQPDAARRRLRAALQGDRARRDGDGAGPGRARPAARPAGAVPRRGHGPALERAADQRRGGGDVRVPARRRRPRAGQRRPADVHAAAARTWRTSS